MPAARVAKPVTARFAALGTLCAVVMAALAGCSSTGTTNSSTSTTTPTTVAAQSTIATTIPFSLAKNARQDVNTTGTCKEVDGTWVLTGTVVNSAKAARTYQIVVDFVNPVGNTVMDTRIVTTPSVRPGATSTWSAKSVAGLAHVACVIHQVQAPA